MAIVTRSFVFSVLTVVSLSACQKSANDLSHKSISSSVEPTNCRTVEHNQGATEICAQPQRIAVLSPFALEPLLALGIQPVAFADHAQGPQGDYDAPREQIPYLGDYVTSPLANLGLAYQPSIEALVELKPDLILGVSFNNADQYETLSKIAPALLLEWDAADTNLRTVAEAVGQPEKAESLIKETEEKIESAKNELSSFVGENTNVLLLSSSKLDQINMGTSAHGLCSRLLTELGFNLVAIEGIQAGSPGSPAVVSLEALAQVKDAGLVILLGTAPDYQTSASDSAESFKEQQLSSLRQAWRDNAIAQSLAPSKTGQVYFIPAYLCLGLPGPIGTALYLEELKQTLLF